MGPLECMGLFRVYGALYSVGPFAGMRMRFVSYLQGFLIPICSYPEPLYQATKRLVRESYNPPPVVPSLIHLYLYLHSPTLHHGVVLN